MKKSWLWMTFVCQRLFKGQFAEHELQSLQRVDFLLLSQEHFPLPLCSP